VLAEFALVPILDFDALGNQGMWEWRTSLEPSTVDGVTGTFTAKKDTRREGLELAKSPDGKTVDETDVPPVPSLTRMGGYPLCPTCLIIIHAQVHTRRKSIGDAWLPESIFKRVRGSRLNDVKR
jgi:hypothetical protein